jgi:hypothetical protein
MGHYAIIPWYRKNPTGKGYRELHVRRTGEASARDGNSFTFFMPKNLCIPALYSRRFVSNNLQSRLLTYEGRGFLLGLN